MPGGHAESSAIPIRWSGSSYPLSTKNHEYASASLGVIEHASSNHSQSDAIFGGSVSCRGRGEFTDAPELRPLLPKPTLGCGAPVRGGMLDEDVENDGDDSKPPQPAVFGSVGGGPGGALRRRVRLSKSILFFTSKDAQTRASVEL